MADSRTLTSVYPLTRRGEEPRDRSAALQQYPLEFVRSNGVLKVAETPKLVTVGSSASHGEGLRRLLESFHRKRVVFISIPSSELSAYLAREALSASSLPIDRGSENRVRLDRLANEAPVVNFVNGLLERAVRTGASDIHFESGPQVSRVRLRLDGRLSCADTFPASLFSAVSTRIKLIAGLNIMERRIPQDGRVTVKLHDRTADIRVSTVPVQAGESIVVRIFPGVGPSAGLEDLGFRRADVEALRAVGRRTSGLILMTGPTGSGKSTTLAALLRLLATADRKIVTIEDPVEQLLAGTVQLQTDDRIGLSFDRLLRHVLRQDPNIIMVGEIRDAPTCELALRASLTGHLILSTLHTNSAVAAVDRLRNLGAPAYLVGEVLQASAAQRLVRRLCPHCKESRLAPRRVSGLLDSFGYPPSKHFVPVGCTQCGGTGYSGRLPLLELFVPDEEGRELIESGASCSTIAARSASMGNRTLLQDGLEKVATGLTSIDELRSVVEVP